MPKLKSDTGTTQKQKLSMSPTTTATAPDGVQGALYYDSTEGVLMAYDTSWQKVSKATATGGTELTVGDGVPAGYIVHKFTGDGTFQVSGGTISCDILVVAGGGSGGSHHGAAGGAGGLLYGTGISLSTSHVIDLGAGGAGGSWNQAGNTGENTTITNLPGGTATALGGGMGGHYGGNGSALNGGSGGGGGY